MKRLHDMTEAERAAEWKRLGMFRYTRQWRAEQRDAHEADREARGDGRAVAPARRNVGEVVP